MVVFGRQGLSSIIVVNVFFWAKMALFVGVGLVSVAPTLLYIGWRRRVRADPSSSRRRTSRAIAPGSLRRGGLFALIPLCAAAIAGYGM